MSHYNDDRDHVQLPTGQYVGTEAPSDIYEQLEDLLDRAHAMPKGRSLDTLKQRIRLYLSPLKRLMNETEEQRDGMEKQLTVERRIHESELLKRMQAHSRLRLAICEATGREYVTDDDAIAAVRGLVAPTPTPARATGEGEA